jgi:hypothetical protein
MRFPAPAIIWSVDWKWGNEISRSHIVLHWGDFNQIISRAGAGRSSELWSTETIRWKNLVNAVAFIGLVWYELYESMEPAIQWEKRLKEWKRR